jgi:hypothetical protein
MRRRKKVKAKKLVKKRVRLHPAAVAEVVLPKGHAPVVVHDPIRNVVAIAPVKKETHWTWWQSLFATDRR